MKSFALALTGLTVTFSFLGSASAADDRVCPVVGSQDNEYWSVVGVQTGQVQPRRELRTLESQYPEQWNLFLHALSHFQAMDQNDKLSYFQLAGMSRIKEVAKSLTLVGIHGAPYKEWDRAKGSGQMGYCAHKTNLFATWHRPYLAAFEQILHQWAVSIASTWPENQRQKMVEEANKLRLPYWDWALDPANGEDGVMPMSLRREKAQVTYPNGTRGEIPNPLYQYKFHPMKAEDFPLVSRVA
jgi:tyrosinase